ncbi:MAG: hypothetical protein V1723_05005 [Candidatus Uhrbacteria bacterium]
MLEAQWANILDRIAEKFTIEERGEEPLPDIPNGKRDFVIFTSPLGRVRLERVTKPRTIGHSAITSRRIGGAVEVKTQYDLDDLVHFLRAQRWDETAGRWVEIDADTFN